MSEPKTRLPLHADDPAPELEYHRLAPLIVHEMEKRGEKPPPHLTEIARRAAAVDLAAVAAMREVAATLDEQRLEFLVIKGFAYGAWLYPRSDLRPREDIDLLLDGWDSVGRAERALRRRGWRSLPRLGGQFVAHAAVLTKRGAPSVDLHARPSQRHRVAAAFAFDAVRAEARRIHIPAVGDLLTMSPRHSLLFSALHRSAHHGGQTAPLIWLEDLARLAPKLGPHDWDLLLDLAQKHDLATAFEAALHDLAWWCPDAVPPRMLETLAARGADASAVYVDRPSTVASFLDDLLVLEPPQVLEFLRELAFPDADFMHRRLGVARNRPLPLLWAARFLRSVCMPGA